MKLLSIDVGIKNLAFCLLEVENNSKNIMKIIQWDIINLSQEDEVKLCCETGKNGAGAGTCNKPAKFTKNGKWFCVKHSKKQEYFIPNSELKPAFINKQKVQSLYEIADKYKIKYTSPIKKAELISLINEYIYNTCFEIVEKTNASKVDLVTIGRNIQYKFDKILEAHLSSIDRVIIENQISPIANRMKTIQGMVSQFFIMRNNNIQIDFVSASNKLKMDSKTQPNPETKVKDDAKGKDKTTYSERKKNSIKQTIELITNQEKYQEWTTFFKNHKKNDDLADSLLQALWYISNKC
jgi:hypothetical protein